MGRRAFLIIIAVVLAAAPAGSAAENRPGLPPRIILVTIDTLRADRLPIYGYPRNTAPFLTALAHGGVTYTCAIAAGSYTAPCHASLFTALYPDQHHVLLNGQRLPADADTLAAEFTSRGYRTAAFASVPFLRHEMAGFSKQSYPELTANTKPRIGAETVDAAIAWIDQQPKTARLFVWVHLFDVHANVRPDEAFAEWARAISKSPDAPDTKTVRDYWIKKEGIPESQVRDPRAAAKLDAYDARIRYVDEELRRLYGAVAGPGAPQSLWVVTADHGEGLGSHGYMNHDKRIYEEQTRIPLIVSFSDRRNAGKRVQGLVRQIDVMPSLCAALGKKPDPKWEGKAFFPFSDRWGVNAALITRRPRAPSEKDSLQSARRYALRARRWKLVWSPDGEREELYDLRTDPLEKTNLAAKNPNRAIRLRSRLLVLLARIKGAGDPQPNTRVPVEEAEAMKSLGYLQ